MTPAKMPDLILVRGAPGSGKSQTAKALSRHFPKGVRMEVDTLRSMVISVDWINQSEHIGVLALSAQTACDFLRLGFCPVIVVDTFSGGKLDGFLETIHEQGLSPVVSIFGLYASKEELGRRLQTRGPEEFTDTDISFRLNEEVLSSAYTGECQINTTELTSDETVAAMLQCMSMKHLSDTSI
jgi:broad-specificity NMP kinase